MSEAGISFPHPHLSLPFAGLGVMLVVVVGIGWKCTPQGHEPCHLLFNLGNHSRNASPRRTPRSHHRHRNHWHGGRCCSTLQGRQLIIDQCDVSVFSLLSKAVDLESFKPYLWLLCCFFQPKSFELLGSPVIIRAVLRVQSRFKACFNLSVQVNVMSPDYLSPQVCCTQSSDIVDLPPPITPPSRSMNNKWHSKMNLLRTVTITACPAPHPLLTDLVQALCGLVLRSLFPHSRTPDPRLIARISVMPLNTAGQLFPGRSKPGPAPALRELQARKPALRDLQAPQPALRELLAWEPALGELQVQAPALGELQVQEPALGELQALEPALGELQALEPALEELQAPEPAPGELQAPEPVLGERQDLVPAQELLQLIKFRFKWMKGDGLRSLLGHKRSSRAL